jgi:hypothetical protein
MSKQLTNDRYQFLMLDVFGTDNARELLEYIRNGLLYDNTAVNFFMNNGKESLVGSDPNGLNSIKTMANLQMIQKFLDYKDNLITDEK